jgi:hypothetical protein
MPDSRVRPGSREGIEQWCLTADALLWQCLACGGKLRDERAHFVCTACGRITEGCCEGAPA